MEIRYVLIDYLKNGFGGGNLLAMESSFNKEIWEVLIAVEWALRDVNKYFTHDEFAGKMIIGDVPVAKWYVVCALLWSFRACLY